MQHFLDDIRGAVADRRWYAALSLALAMPDICGRLEYGRIGSEARSVRWFADYAQAHYKGRVESSGEQICSLTGADCYALRCAYLHQGDVDISEQRAREVLDRFDFITPDGVPIHMAYFNSTPKKVLLLQVDLFCEDMCASVERWLVAMV
ncbi:MAG TPA: hypothetical protein VIX73_06105, partial [Kofleriaceae bacterium]